MPPRNRTRIILRATCVAALVLAGRIAVAAGLTFNTTIGPGLIALEGTNPTLAANIQASFAQAEDIWSAHLLDSIEVNLSLDWEELGPGTLASASSEKVFFPYSDVRTHLAADRTSADDFTAYENIPAGPINGFSSRRDGTRFFNDAETIASTTLFFNRANAKALGMLAADSPSLDGAIRFNSLFDDDWDFSHTPTPGLYDFLGVALHEIGHALGFTTGVSSVDQYTGAGPLADFDLNGSLPGIGTGEEFPVFSVLDLFRHSDESNAVDPMALELAPGGTPYFQIDGSTPLALFSTGEYNGDGRQPSHWKFNVPAVLKPSFGRGTIQDITPLDLLAFDVIGFDIVPEPSTYALGLLAATMLVGYGHRRRRSRRRG